MFKKLIVSIIFIFLILLWIVLIACQIDVNDNKAGTVGSTEIGAPATTVAMCSETLVSTTTVANKSEIFVPTPEWEGDTLYWSYLNFDGVVYTMATHTGFGNKYLDLENKIIPEANGEPTVEKFIAEEKLEKFASVEKVQNNLIPEEPLAAANLELGAAIYKVPDSDDALYVCYYPADDKLPMQLRLFLPMNFDPKTTDIYFMSKTYPTN